MNPLPDAACTSVGDESVDGEAVGFDGVGSVYNYGDGTTTACLESAEPRVICMYGYAADAGPDYVNWGAALGMQLTTEDPDGIVSPMNATALGIASVEFTVSGLGSWPTIRPQLTMVDDPNVPAGDPNYENNPFVFGGGIGLELRADGSYELSLSTFEQPVWSQLDVDGDGFPDRADPSRLHAFGFQVVTQPGFASDYRFCVSDLRWLDSAGNVVLIPTSR